MESDYHPQKYDTRVYNLLVVLSQCLSLLVVILMAVWTGSYLGGFSWGGKEATWFNYHPLFMTIGMFFLYGDAIMVYRVFRNERKIVTKMIHLALQAITFVLTVIGLIAAFGFHNANNIPNLYSIHSWLGLTTTVLFGLQFIMGLVSFLIPGVPHSFKRDFMPLHVFFGVFLYVMVIATCVLGLTEKMIFMKTYKDMPGSAWMGNFIGVFMIFTGVIILFVVTKPEYKRQNLPEEEPITYSLQ